LAQAADADLLDTSDLTVEEAVANAIRLVEARLARTRSADGARPAGRT
jgi:cytidylate kinase